MNHETTRHDASPRQRGGAGLLIPGLLSLLLLGAGGLAQSAQAQNRRGGFDAAQANTEFAASQALQRAQTLMEAGETDRGVKLLETLVQQYPTAQARFEAYLLLGKHHLDQRQLDQAIRYFKRLADIERMYEDRDEIPPDMLDLMLEGRYRMGVSYFQMRQFGSAFPVLRRITTDWPNTVWSNQAYYYIGLCHFAQSNWNRAIKALSVVGTFVDPDSPTVENVEAGRRFYVKISDADLPVLHRLGQTVAVEVTSTSGDAERVECTPLSGTDEFFVGSVPTVLGKASERTHGDGKLQVIGGDKIKTVYVDANTFDGKQEVNRDKTVRVVSTGAVTFTLGDYDSPAPGAFLGQPVFVLLQDADLDTSDQVDAVEVRMVSRYARPEPEEQAAGADGQVDLDALFSDDDQDEYVVRDEVTLTLEELPDPEASAGAPVRTGRFVGRLTLQQGREAQDANRTDSLMECILGDELMVSYTDTLHINGEAPRTINATIRVVDEISANPQVQQQVIEDPIVGFEKNLVEAEAFLELSRIFNSMGLKEGATEKADNGLQRVDQIIQADFPVPRPMVEQAFKLKWELQQSKGNLSGALMTCKLFSEMFPDSAFVDQALLGIADVRREAGSFAEAIRIYDQILGLPNSLAKAEAQFRIAQTYQAEADQDPDNEGTASQAVRAYEAVAQQYPDSEFAGEALAHLVDYYIENSDYVQADDLLRQVFLDHPDADFLDQMLLKWALVAARMGDFQKAYDKCSQLVFEYPTSRFAGKAKQILQTLEKRLNR